MILGFVYITYRTNDFIAVIDRGSLRKGSDNRNLDAKIGKKETQRIFTMTACCTIDHRTWNLL